MVTHPRRNRLAQYGGRIIQTDGRRTVELRDPSDNSRARSQYRRTLDGGLERRRLQSSGEPFLDTGSPWESYTESALASLVAVRGPYHPILDPLGL